MPYNFTAIEKRWQQYWLANKTFRALEPADAGDMPKAYILDMFPYPSGAGLHVGHPEGYTATDIVCRYLRMKGFNVMHPMGWDAFGLPAEQHAIRTGQHPRITTEQLINRFRLQIQALGLSYDWDREVDTTDPNYYKWTQWIFLQIFNSYFDPLDRKAKPIAHLYQELQNENLVVAPDGSVRVNPVQEGMEAITGDVRVERLWRELSPEEQREIIDGQRLAYMDEVPVNWCPGLGTVLANEEVIDGKSEVGGFPVEKRPMRQWMLRITTYADRLLKDLDLLAWPESLKEMQRNWIGKSEGAEIDFEVAPPEHEDSAASARDRAAEAADDDLVITVFTTRPDTLFGATYMVLAPEHPLVDRITPPSKRETVEAYRTQVAARSERDRLAEQKEKTGVFIGAYAINPVNDRKLPIYIADYVLMSYGTGAIMAVPGQDQRDWDFARKYDLPIIRTVQPPDGFPDQPYLGEGPAINSDFLNGMPVAEAKERMIQQLEREGVGVRSAKYKLHDWLFSRQRYWGEPFPIALDAEGNAYAVEESELPVTLPEMEDFKPTGTPEPPLSKAKDWIHYESPRLRRENVGPLRRETNTMPQWAGSCWYYLRYLDPQNSQRFVDPAKERYWMPVDLYVGGAEHAVLHLLYARFWHKVLFDLGHVSTPEPFMRLVNQGTILGETEYAIAAAGASIDVQLRDSDDDEAPRPAAPGGRKLTEDEVVRTKDGYFLKSDPTVRVEARAYKMSKSRGNVVNPDQIIENHGADAFRLYEMYMGPLEAVKPWNTRDIVGMTRFLNAVWRNLVGDAENGEPASAGGRGGGGGGARGGARISTVPIAPELDRMLHRTIKKVGDDVENLRFNTAIAELIKLNNEMTGMPVIPRDLAETFTLLLAPFAPHIAEEVWRRLGHEKSLSRRPWPGYDPAKLLEDTIELPVQVNGKLRDRITVSADADEATIFSAAEAAERVRPWIAGKEVRKRLYVPKKLVNFVVG